MNYLEIYSCETFHFKKPINQQFFLKGILYNTQIDTIVIISSRMVAFSEIHVIKTQSTHKKMYLHLAGKIVNYKKIWNISRILC